MIKHNQLDIPINELYPEALNTQTTREFIRETEEAFGLGQKEINALNEKQLSAYIDWLDDLWNK